MNIDEADNPADLTEQLHRLFRAQREWAIMVDLLPLEEWFVDAEP